MPQIKDLTNRKFGNVQWGHKQINFMKQSLTDKEFINWCFRVVSHQKNKG
jgi:hypothetical protein